MQEALKDQSADEASEEKQVSEGEESADSGFGLSGAAKKKVPAKRATKKGAVTMVPASEPTANASGRASDGSVKPTGTPSAKAEATKGKKAENVVQAAGSLLAGLRQVSMLAVWNMPQKQKDLQGKLSKAMDLCSKLGQLHGNAEAESTKVALEQQADQMSTWADLVSQLKDNDPCPRVFVRRLEANKSRMITALGQQSPECVRAVLVDIGRMLSEARTWQ